MDKLTYAGNPENLRKIENNPNYRFVRGDICNSGIVDTASRGVDAILNFAAETHVDRSISGPEAFVKTNVNGTFQLLQQSLEYWKGLSGEKKDQFRFLHVSTDEVYGTLGFDDPAFCETTPYAPNSPYANGSIKNEDAFIDFGPIDAFSLIAT